VKKLLSGLFLLVALTGAANAWDGEEPAVSTHPIGSSYYRHLAADFDIDLHELIKFERKGFGRAEIVTLILISQQVNKPLKDLGNRRIKDQVLLKDLAKEAKLDYDSLYLTAREIKADIESRGDKNLPPPVFEKVKEDPEKLRREKAKEEKRKRKEEKKKKKEEQKK
jgi:hypothetical protein